MSCGHPVECIVSSDEGTAYCAMCVLEAENARLRNALQEVLNQLPPDWRVCQVVSAALADAPSEPKEN